MNHEIREKEFWQPSMYLLCRLKKQTNKNNNGVAVYHKKVVTNFMKNMNCVFFLIVVSSSVSLFKSYIASRANVINRLQVNLKIL